VHVVEIKSEEAKGGVILVFSYDTLNQLGGVEDYNLSYFFLDKDGKETKIGEQPKGSDSTDTWGVGYKYSLTLNSFVKLTNPEDEHSDVVKERSCTLEQAFADKRVKEQRYDIQE
jgi:hypothetical protein